MFAAGVAAAGPGGRSGRILQLIGVDALRLRPARFDGGVLLVDPADAGHLCVAEEFALPPVACDLSRVSFTPDTVIDCGAHIGAFTVLARRRYPRAAITAYEPNPANVRWLERNVHAAGGETVTIVAAAASVSNGRAEFSQVAGHSESGRLGGVVHGTPAYDVDVVDLPAVLRRAAPSSLLLKIDIEGEEERLVPALIGVLPARSAIFFETHGGERAWTAVSSALAGAGFRVERLNARGAFSDGFATRGGEE